jgi:hypothetical protein
MMLSPKGLVTFFFFFERKKLFSLPEQTSGNHPKGYKDHNKYTDQRKEGIYRRPKAKLNQALRPKVATRGKEPLITKPGKTLA